MSIQEVSSKGKEQIQGYPSRKQAGRSEGFQESLMQNLKSQEQESAVTAEEMKKSSDDSETEIKVGSREEKIGSRTERVEDRMGVGMTGNPSRIRVNAVTNREAVQNVEVRHMSYEESDHIEIAVTQGYTLKGKLEGRHVYVEAKYDDGRFEAYRVDTDKVAGETEHRIEQFALETADRVTG